MDFKLRGPCANCPFRHDAPLYLSRARREEISGYVTRTDQTFACHKTTLTTGNGKEQVCGGALILHLKEGMPNWRYRLAEQLGLWSRENMVGQDLVYSSAEAMTRGHE